MRKEEINDRKKSVAMMSKLQDRSERPAKLANLPVSLIAGE